MGLIALMLIPPIMVNPTYMSCWRTSSNCGRCGLRINAFTKASIQNAGRRIRISHYTSNNQWARYSLSYSRMKIDFDWIMKIMLLIPPIMVNPTYLSCWRMSDIPTGTNRNSMGLKVDCYKRTAVRQRLSFNHSTWNYYLITLVSREQWTMKLQTKHLPSYQMQPSS